VRTPKSTQLPCGSAPFGSSGPITAVNTQVRWGINNGLWVLGAAAPAEYLRKIADYTFEGIGAQIQAPTLIPDAEPGIGVSNNLA
jgi:hypothetical protein